jgi:cysteine desulfurase NifS
VTLRALVTDDICQGTIDANMGGGGPVGPKAWQNCNINDLTDLNQYDPISGFPVYKALLCEVSLADTATERAVVDSGEYGAPDEFDNNTVSDKPVRRIYLDHNATTYLDDEVHRVMEACLQSSFGNPSAIYAEGREAKADLESARRQVAQLLNCTARRIVLTGGGSESNNLAIKGAAFANWNEPKHLITTAIEHPAVLQTCRWLERFGWTVTYLPVDRNGMVSVDAFKRAIRDDTFLATIMLANNETGSILPVTEMAAVAREQKILFHTDATQAVGKIPVDVAELGVDMLTLSGHKLYGPKGVGALYVRQGLELDPLIHGGKQERGLRAGTENLINIIGLGKAAELALQHLPAMAKTQQLRDKLQHGIMAIIPDARLNGDTASRLPNTLNMILPAIRGEALTLALDQRGVSISSGSACRSGSPDPSHALLAMGLTEDEAHCSIRLSLGIRNTEADIDRTLQLLGDIVRDDKSMVRFVPCR